MDKSVAPRYWAAGFWQARSYQYGGPKKLGICVHHQAGFSDDILGTYNANGTSAHYQATNTDIKQNVHEYDRAYATGVQFDGTRWGQDYLISIETQNDGGDPDWHVSDGAVESLTQCLVGIAQNQGWPSLHWHGDKWTVGYVCAHRDLGATACPGDYLYKKLPGIVAEANKRLKGKPMAPPETCNVWMYTVNGTPAQRWTPIWKDDTWFELRPECRPDLRLDCMGGGKVLWAYPANGSDNQLFRIQQDKRSYKPAQALPVQIVPKTNEKYRVDVSGGGTAPGTDVGLYQDNNTAAQDFVIIDAGKGYWTIVNTQALLALDVEAAGK